MYFQEKNTLKNNLYLTLKHFNKIFKEIFRIIYTYH
jgi:hypothetical protein